MPSKKPSRTLYAVKAYIVEEGPVVKKDSYYHGWYEVRLLHSVSRRQVERWLHPTPGECHKSMAASGYYMTTRAKYLPLTRHADDLIVVKGLL